MAPISELAIRKAWEVFQDEVPKELEQLVMAIELGTKTLEDAESKGYTPEQVTPLATSVIKASDLYHEAKTGWSGARSWVPSFSQLKWSTGVHASRMRARERELRTQVAGLLNDPPPATAPRGCTDVCCLVIFLVALGGLWLIIQYALANGNVKRLTALPDFQGRLCGVSVGVEDKPLLFFCQEPAGHLLYDFPICVSECPVPKNMVGLEVGCPQHTAPSYSSRPFLGMLCVRSSGALSETDSEASWHWQTKTVQLMERVAMVQRAWPTIALPAILSAVLGLLYVGLLEHFPLVVAWTGLITFSTIWGGIGVIMIWVSQRADVKVLPGRETPAYFLAIGIVLCCMSITAAAVAFAKRETINRASGCIKASCEVIRDMPSLMLEPIIAFVTYVVTGVWLSSGLVHLMSLAKRQREGSSLYVDRVYDTHEYIYIAYYIFMVVWVLEFCSAFSMFAIAHAAQQWFFSPAETGTREKRVPCCPGVVSWFVGVRSHLGTLALGSFIIVLLRPLRAIISLMVEAINMENAIGKCLRRAGMCLVVWYDRTLLFVNKTAFIDVAVHGSSFVEATEHTRDLLGNSATSAADLHGASWLCQIAGMGGISAVGGWMTYLMCRYTSEWGDSRSLQFVQDPWLMAMLSAAVCMYVAWPFMLVFSHVSDTILFCFALERQRHSRISQEWESTEIEDMSSGFLHFLHDEDEVELRANTTSRDHPPETQALLKSTLTAKLGHGIRKLSSVVRVAPWHR